MVKYMIFAGLNYYPSGGANDLVGCFTIDKADNNIAKQKAMELMSTKFLNEGYDWWHIMNENGEIIFEYMN